MLDRSALTLLAQSGCTAPRSLTFSLSSHVRIIGLCGHFARPTYQPRSNSHASTLYLKSASANPMSFWLQASINKRVALQCSQAELSCSSPEGCDGFFWLYTMRLRIWIELTARVALADPLHGPSILCYRRRGNALPDYVYCYSWSLFPFLLFHLLGFSR